MLQIVRPDGNAFERWKWRHRYLLVTLGICAGMICFIRAVISKSPVPSLFSWFTLESYLLAVPIAIAVIALYCLLVMLRFRLRAVARFLISLVTRSLLR
jgi:hypothetical protein